jgi:hypothetical protein
MDLFKYYILCEKKESEQNVFKREVSCFLTPEHGLMSFTTNDSGGSVDFGWDKIWGHLKSSNKKASYAVMIHTHPEGMNEMSSTDINMVQGWRLALGIPIHFYIVTKFFRDKLGYEVALYICDKNEFKKINIRFYNWMMVDSIKDYNYRILCNIMYGLSMGENIKESDSLDIENALIDIGLSFDKSLLNE